MRKIFFPLSVAGALFFISAVSVSTSSCEKEPITLHDTTEVSITVHDTVLRCPASILGLWIGTYTADQLPNDPARYFSFIIKPNGGLVVESQPTGGEHIFATGTWSLNGTTLTCSYVYPNTAQGYSVNQTATAAYDSTSLKLTSGIWTNIGSPGGTGKFSLQKVR
jgi:hypothetical protein